MNLMISKDNLTIVSAIGFESKPTIEALKNIGVKVDFYEFGIGCLNAAKNCKEIAVKLEHKDVIYIGTCGSFYPYIKGQKLEIVTSEFVEWLPLCERLKKSWSIEGIELPYHIKNLSDQGNGIQKKKVICSPTISADATLPENYIREDYVENLELYSVIKEFAANSKSITPILVVTNEVCKDGRIQWKNNFKTAAEKTAEYIVKMFECEKEI